MAKDKPSKGKRGRQTVYTKAIADKICKRLAEGWTLRQVCREPGMPLEQTVRGWALKEGHPFAAQYARAREQGYHAMADELLDIADDGRNDWMKREGEDDAGWLLNGEHVQRSRIRLDTRKWLLSKALPKVYGDKLQHTGEGGEGPIKHQHAVTWLTEAEAKALGWA